MKKSKSIFKLIYLFVLVFFTNNFIIAQDPHYSQYEASSSILNPALTGNFGVSQKFKVATQYRSQWGPLGGRIATSSLSYDMVYEKRWGIGGYLMDYDAPGNFNSLNVVLSGAYKITLPNQDKQILTAGLQAGVISKNNKDLVFDNQYSSGNFDSDLPSGENYRKYSIFMPEVNVGIAYKQLDKTKKVNPYGGFSLFHVTRPKERFFETSQNSRLPIRSVLNVGTTVLVTDQVTIEPHALWMNQRKANDLIMGIRGFYDFKNGTTVLNNSTLIIAGFSYRWKDALICEAGVKYKTFLYKFSYDVTVSSLKSFNNKRGALELSIVYRGN